MSGQENIELVKQCYEAFAQGDIERLLNYMKDDVDWELPLVEGVPFSGKRQGRNAVGEFFALVGSFQELREFRPEEFTAQGDRVVVTGRYAWLVKPTGTEFSCEWCHIFHIAGGKFSKFKEFTDTNKAALAYELVASNPLKAATRPGADQPAAH
ncbi:nuclear transport factor 2 family protein [Massilia niastensis]|uniref:nuclear transport factor 2 family protein n=1 Tax=Massilia niastensis TaxID=544911 RepID=UPI00036634DB|nr:nuclear transport factor 2 family protein [Massilia niastensis]